MQRIMPSMFPLRQCVATILFLATATACAADPAKTILGVELGTRFLFPPCTRGEETIPRRHCYSEGQISKTPWGAEVHRVYYVREKSAPYARGELVIDVINGFITAIHINTWGIEAQGPAFDALTKKYGPPLRKRTEKIRALRARLPSLFAEWEMADFSVKYDGTTSTIDWGRITLATHRYRQIVRSFEAAR